MIWRYLFRLFQLQGNFKKNIPSIWSPGPTCSQNLWLRRRRIYRGDPRILLDPMKRARHEIAHHHDRSPQPPLSPQFFKQRKMHRSTTSNHQQHESYVVQKTRKRFDKNIVEAPSRWTLHFFKRNIEYQNTLLRTITYPVSPTKAHLSRSFLGWDPFGSAMDEPFPGRIYSTQKFLLKVSKKSSMESFLGAIPKHEVESAGRHSWMAPPKNPRNWFSQEATMKYFTTKD